MLAAPADAQLHTSSVPTPVVEDQAASASILVKAVRHALAWEDDIPKMIRNADS